MTHTSNIALNIAPARSGLYENIVLNLLQQMPYGRLNLTLPNGQTVRIGNGEGIHADATIYSPEFFKRSVLYGDIGFGEAYVDGLWDSSDVYKVIAWFLQNVEHSPTISGTKMRAVGVNLLNFFNKLFHFNRANTLSGSRKNISEHYDLSNDFYKLWLDDTITYSSAYFKTEDMGLEEAQYEKYDRLCQQVKLKKTDHVLEIGSGWGSFSIHMAKNYGCRVTTVTISEQQYILAKQRIEEAGVSDLVDIRIMDYRHLEGQFDKIVSVEMLEAVGHKFLPVFFKKCQELLKKEGIMAFQVITCPDSRYDELRKGVDWIQKHIFPGSLLPSVKAINAAVNATGDLTLVDLKEMGLHYAKTLKIWRENFNAKLDEIKNLGFDETFIRKWNYYLCYCEAAFQMRNIFVKQFVYTRPNSWH